MYIQGEVNDGGFIVLATSGHLGKETFLAADRDDLRANFADFERDYGLEGWTFKVYELELNERAYNIIPPEPAKIVLI